MLQHRLQLGGRARIGRADRAQGRLAQPLGQIGDEPRLQRVAGELRAMQENWPKISFHALREHAGLVFHKQMDA